MTAWTTVKCMLGCNVTLRVYIGVMRQSFIHSLYSAQVLNVTLVPQQSITRSWCKTERIRCSVRSHSVGFIFPVPSPFSLCCTVIQFWLWTLFSHCSLDSQAIAEISLSGTNTDKKRSQRSVPSLMSLQKCRCLWYLFEGVFQAFPSTIYLVLYTHCASVVLLSVWN